MMSGELFVALAGSGVVGAVGSAVLAVLRARGDARSAESEAKTADAHVVEVVHDVYGGTIDMLRGELGEHRLQISSLQEELWGLSVDNKRLRARVLFLESWFVRSGLEVPRGGAEGG